MRYLWDQYHDYRQRAGFVRRASMPLLCHYLRNWDIASASRVDAFIANSNFIRRRIRRAWGRDSNVVHPPVPVGLYGPSQSIGDHYLWVGQLVAYKRPDLAIHAFNQLGLPLLVIGDGEMASELKRGAGPNIRFVERMPFDGLRQAYAQAKALIFTAEEDFGIVPVEANAAGRPVIAYGRGGVLDSIIEGRTGIFFGEQSVEALVDAVERLEHWLPEFNPAAAVENVQRFSPERFDLEFLEAVDRARGRA
jgi:glycosyltransferase involved in cell wall biosynthesis